MTDKLATTGNTGLGRPSYLAADDIRGIDGITKDDIQLPRLALAQGISPELIDTNERYIPDLKVGQLFNNVTREVIGKGPIEFTVLRADPPRYVEFIPRKEGGGIRDFNVPANDPRTQFGPGGEQPVATKFYDFVIATLPIAADDPMSSVIGLSFKSTGLKVARNLNTLMLLRKSPSFAGKYKLVTGTATNSKGTFAVYLITNSDLASEASLVVDGVPKNGWLSEAQFTLASGLFELFKDKKINIAVDDAPEGGDAAVATPGGM